MGYMNFGRQLVLCLVTIVTLSACRSLAYFHTSNDMLRQPATVYLQDGKEKNGEITIFFETTYPPKDYITLSSGGSEEKIKAGGIRGYRIKGKYYVPRYIDLDGNGIEHLLFVQQLTPDTSRIQLYELYERKQGVDANGEDPFTYYISTPALPKYVVWNASSKYLVPRFEEKMSRLVADCPALAQKIEQQQHGYFYAQLVLSNHKKAEVLRRIIDEYNACR
jgi:hypothetical protein